MRTYTTFISVSKGSNELQKGTYYDGVCYLSVAALEVSPF